MDATKHTGGLLCMIHSFIFDVDGTLTPSRGTMNEGFKKFFLNFIEDNPTYLVTGSDYIKTIEQVGQDVCEKVEACYNCSGNSVWRHGEEIHSSEWKISEKAKNWLTERLKESKFGCRTGNHIEERPGLVNFSIVGRNATVGERQLYVGWDQEEKERMKISQAFNKDFPGLNAQVAGETGIDIIPKGYDKSQVAAKVDGPCIFFGDKMKSGGNDYPLGRALRPRKDSAVIEVRDWKHTQQFLRAWKIKDVHELVGVV